VEHNDAVVSPAFIQGFASTLSQVVNAFITMLAGACIASLLFTFTQPGDWLMSKEKPQAALQPGV
jgi:hypothetical protein